MKLIQSEAEQNLTQAVQTLESTEDLSSDQKREVLYRLKKGVIDVRRFSSWIESAQKLSDLGSWEHDHKTDELIWSAETFRIFGFDPLSVEPSHDVFIQRIHPEDKERINKAYHKSLEEQKPYHVVYRLQLPDNTIKYVEAHAKHFYDDAGNPLLTLGTNQNVTKRELEKRNLSESLETKQTLLGEIHHRVKNNLAVVAGVLQLQSLQEDNPEIAHALEDSMNRIKTVANIHQHLYQSDHFEDVSLGDNIEKLASDLVATMETDANIEMISECDHIQLDIKKTLPCSLIANEVITNALKHAFEGREEGTIWLKVCQEDDQIGIDIKDNGVGLPDNFRDKTDSLGMSLIDTLTKQLDGTYEFISEASEGTTFTCRFPLN